MVWDEKWQSTYDYTMQKLYQYVGEYQEWKLWKWYLETQTQYGTPSIDNIDIYVTDGQTLDETCMNFMQALNQANILIDLDKYLKTSYYNRFAIKQTWQIILQQTPSPDVIEYWNEQTGRNLKQKIDFFSWLFLLYFGLEGKQLGIHLVYISLFKAAKYSLMLEIPSFAVILCGHTRSFARYKESHKCFIENIYCDVFIHTWDKMGPRSYTGETGTRFINGPVDVNLLNVTYHPVKLQIETLDIHRPEFSLLGHHDLIFLSQRQQKDDATFYCNADLYSLYKTSLLIQQYEIEKNFQYSGIIKLSFIYNMCQFDFKNICDDITQRENTFYIPKGCKRCDMEATWPYLYTTLHHNGHMNNFDVYWMYGRRNVMLNACSLYLNTIAIADDVLDANIAAYVNVAAKRKYREFVYIFDGDYLEKKIYSIDSLATRVQEFEPENLFRIHMNSYFCLKGNYICGKFADFDSVRDLFW